jgi:hypothetical protein
MGMDVLSGLSRLLGVVDDLEILVMAILVYRVEQ